MCFSDHLVLSRQCGRFAASAARHPAPVLLTGETGTGKSEFAKLIHRMSPRAAGPFERVDIGTCPASLLAVHLFGCERGAYTDAREMRRGVAELAEGGTLFIDEIDGLGVEDQRTLLTLCQERVFSRIGSSHKIRADIRVITASNVPVNVLLEEGRLRRDLFYRLGVFTHQLPPLRERHSEFREIVATVFRRTWQLMSGGASEAPALDDVSIEILKRHQWPGNIRELENVLVRVSDLLLGSAVGVADAVREALHQGEGPYCVTAGGNRRTSYRSREPGAIERDAIARALVSTHGSLDATRKLLGMSRQTLWRKLRKYQLSKGPHLGDMTFQVEQRTGRAVVEPTVPASPTLKR